MNCSVTIQWLGSYFLARVEDVRQSETFFFFSPKSATSILNRSTGLAVATFCVLAVYGRQWSMF